jgi:hypothetical protein
MEVIVSNVLTLTHPEVGASERPGLPAPGWHERQMNEEFVAMTRAFGQTGGISHGDDIARRLSEYAAQPISIVARWIVNREALAFAWNRQTLLPLFQFDPSSMTLRPGVSVILRELSDVFDSWGCALWFVQSNAWLADQLPVDLMETSAREVLDAARVDRFIARG